MDEGERRSHAARASVALAVAALGWGLSPIFIRGLSVSYDPLSQAFIRYFGASLFLLATSSVLYPAELKRAFLRPRATLALAILNVLMQSLWTVGCYLATATAAQLITKTEVVFVIVVSFIFFREERTVIRRPLFLVGTALSVTGLLGILVRDPEAVLAPTIDAGVLILLAVSVLWSFYAVWGKHIVADLHPLPMFTAVATYTAAGLGLLALVAGRPACLLEAGMPVALLALASGVLPIGMSHSSFHYAQKYLGAAFCASVLLLNPLVTHLGALVFWEDEALSWAQWAGAGLLILGAYLVVEARRRQDEPGRPCA